MQSHIGMKYHSIEQSSLFGKSYATSHKVEGQLGSLVSMKLTRFTVCDFLC